MSYLISKVFPYIWPYLKEAITGWIKHPYFRRNGHAVALRKIGIILLFISWIILGGEYINTLNQFDALKEEIRTKPPAYVSFEDVKNYHALFNSPEIQESLNQCRVDIYALNKELLDKGYALELEKQLHTKAKEELELFKSKRKVTSKPIPDSDNRDALNRRLNPKKDE